MKRSIIQKTPGSKKSADTTWLSPPRGLSLGPDEIHVWRCFLARPELRRESLEAVLSDDESSRAARFRFERDRLRFIATRGILRTILGRYLGSDPAEVRFIYGINGKPSLAGEQGQRLCFNVSHSRDLALFAFACDRKIGVDAEYVDHDRTIAHIVERFYSPGEISAFNSLRADKQQDAFFTFWTCKEAYLKAEGTGLSFGLEKVEIALSRGKHAALAAIDGDAQKAALWTLHVLDVTSEYAAALAVNGQGLVLKKWEWGVTPP